MIEQNDVYDLERADVEIGDEFEEIDVSKEQNLPFEEEFETMCENNHKETEIEQERPIKVYVKRNEQGEIVEVASEIFLDDLTGWEYFDEGYGDKFAHAQCQYFQSGTIRQ